MATGRVGLNESFFQLGLVYLFFVKRGSWLEFIFTFLGQAKSKTEIDSGFGAGIGKVMVVSRGQSLRNL